MKGYVFVATMIVGMAVYAVVAGTLVSFGLLITQGILGYSGFVLMFLALFTALIGHSAEKR